MDDDVVFGAFDPTAEIEIRERNLPHWFQPGVAVFITFRTIDSLPREVVTRINRELVEWLVNKGLPPARAERSNQAAAGEYHQTTASLTQADARQLKRRKDRLYHDALDECHGRCLLKNLELANIVGEAILHSNLEHYDVDSFVVMPNHVHVLAQFHKDSSLSIVGQSWMRYTARQINALLEESGAFWQPEPFDHLVRSSEQFRYLQQYIANNPRQARLGLEKTLYWCA